MNNPQYYTLLFPVSSIKFIGKNDDTFKYNPNSTWFNVLVNVNDELAYLKCYVEYLRVKGNMFEYSIGSDRKVELYFPKIKQKKSVDAINIKV